MIESISISSLTSYPQGRHESHCEHVLWEKSGVQQKQESTFLNHRMFIPTISNLHSAILLGEFYITPRKPSTLFCAHYCSGLKKLFLNQRCLSSCVRGQTARRHLLSLSPSHRLWTSQSYQDVQDNRASLKK